MHRFHGPISCFCRCRPWASRLLGCEKLLLQGHDCLGFAKSRNGSFHVGSVLSSLSATPAGLLFIGPTFTVHLIVIKWLVLAWETLQHAEDTTGLRGHCLHRR